MYVIIVKIQVECEHIHIEFKICSYLVGLHALYQPVHSYWALGKAAGSMGSDHPLPLHPTSLHPLF